MRASGWTIIELALALVSGPVWGLAGGAACGDDGGATSDARATDTEDPGPVDTSGFEITVPDTAIATDTATPDTADAAPEITSNGSGYIEVGATTITGRAGLVFIAFGPNQQTRYCVPIESDAFAVPLGRLTLNEDNPCGFETADILFPAGPHEVTAGIFVHGETTPIVAATRTVVVDGDAWVEFDGAALSAPTGASGQLVVTSTPITGQAGRVLLVLATDTLARLCVPIDASPFTLTPTPMTVLAGNPCGEATAVATFSGGEQHLVGGVYVPGEQTPRSEVAVLVLVDGDTTVTLDGAALSQ